MCFNLINFQIVNREIKVNESKKLIFESSRFKSNGDPKAK